MTADAIAQNVMSDEEYLSRLFADAPPLTAEQRDRLRVLLAPGHQAAERQACAS